MHGDAHSKDNLQYAVFTLWLEMCLIYIVPASFHPDITHALLIYIFTFESHPTVT